MTPPELKDARAMSELQKMAEQALARGAEYPALEWRGRWIHWDELARAAAALQALVIQSGANPGARVAMLPRNRPSAVAALLGLIALGRSVSMVHVYQSSEGIARDIVRMKPALVIADREDASPEVVEAVKAIGAAGIVLDADAASYMPCCERSTVEAQLLEAPQLELLTSGTTGPPKPFALSYELIATHMVGKNLFNTAQAADPRAAPPIFMYLAFNTISGVYLTLPTLLPGMRGVLVERFTLPAWRDYVVRHRPTAVGLPIPAIQMILDADVPREELSSLRSIGTGTAPLDPTVQRVFEEKYGIPILLAYGATELGGPVTAMTLDDAAKWGRQKTGSVGRAFAGAKLRVVDPETGGELASGEAGLLEVMTPRMGDSWIRTSDIGVIDEDGFVYHRGRADGAINRGGFKVLPDDVERALRLHEAVAAAAVTGIPDARLGQAPAAAIQLRSGYGHVGAGELEAHLRKHAPATHIPVEWLFVEALPYNAMLKVDRQALRRLFRPDAG